MANGTLNGWTKWFLGILLSLVTGVGLTSIAWAVRVGSANELIKENRRRVNCVEVAVKDMQHDLEAVKIKQGEDSATLKAFYELAKRKWGD